MTDDFPKSIIHADDDLVIQDLVARSLKGVEGLDLISCSDGAALIEKISQSKPSLVLLDLTMPGINGLDAIQNMRDNELRDIPIIILTGHSNMEMRDEYHKAGIIGVITKPFSPGMLPERIRYLWCEYSSIDKDINPQD